MQESLQAESEAEAMTEAMIWMPGNAFKHSPDQIQACHTAKHIYIAPLGQGKGPTHLSYGIQQRQCALHRPVSAPVILHLLAR